MVLRADLQTHIGRGPWPAETLMPSPRGRTAAERERLIPTAAWAAGGPWR